jgi:iron complex outermembrane recepter protein
MLPISLIRQTDNFCNTGITENKFTKRSSSLIAILPLLALLYTGPAQADQQGSDDAVQLGEVDVQSTSQDVSVPSGTSSNVITQEQIVNSGALNLGQALSEVAGLTPTTTGQRAESQLYIRGFNTQQVTLNIDGIPIYVPYDGNVDLSRLLTTNIDHIVVTKGLGSLMYGPNNMGGSVNIVTQVPTRKFEGTLSAGVTANESKLYGDNFGMQLSSRLNNRWYLQGGVATSNSNGFPLSDAYTPVAAQPGGDRLHAQSENTNGNLKIGYTPNASDEYALGIYTVNSTKQSAPYTGNTAVTGQKVAYWDWPQWDKQSYYFIGNTAVGKGYIKTRLYQDNFINRLNTYDNANYNTTAKSSSFLSKYDDYSMGGSVELGQPLGASNFIKLAAFYKQDVHRETSFATTSKPYNSPWLNFKAHTESLGFEDAYTINPLTKAVFGYRYDRHQFDQAQQYTDSTSTAVQSAQVTGPVGANNGQIVVTHDFSGTLWRAGVGLKTRFPGIKDTYSYRLGQAIPNPALGPEQALNREIGVSGRIPGGGHYDIAAYWDSIHDAIQFVTISPGLGQNQNVGTATNRGVDMTMQMPLGNKWMTSLRYSYLNSVLGTPGLVATNAPKNTGGASLTWFAQAATEITADLQASSSRQSSTNGLQPVSGYAVMNLMLMQKLSKQLSLHAGIYNLFDKNYALTEGFPMPGRLLHAELDYKF